MPQNIRQALRALPPYPALPMPEPLLLTTAALAKRRRTAIILLSLLALVIAGTALAAALGARPYSVGDFGCFYNAGIAVLRGDSPYLLVREDNLPCPPYAIYGGAYIYPPFPAFLFAPFALLGSPPAAQVAWIALNALFAAGAMLILADETRKRLGAIPDALSLAVFALIPTVLLFDKVANQFELGQTDFLVLLALALALRWLDRRALAAGAMIALAISVKYVAIVFLPYLLLRRRWKALAGVAAAAALMVAVPMLRYGPAEGLNLHLYAFAGLAEMMGATVPETAATIFPFTWIRSVSIPSGLARFSDYLGHSDALAYALTALIALACLLSAWVLYTRAGFALFLRPKVKDEPKARPDLALLTLLEFAALTTAALLFSPQTTARHMLLMAIPLTLAAGLLTADHTPRPRGPILIAMLAFALALILPPGQTDFAEPLYAWRAASGHSLLALVLLYTLIPYTLAHAKTLRPPQT